MIPANLAESVMSDCASQDSVSLELCRALLEERGHAFALISGRKEAREGAGFERVDRAAVEGVIGDVPALSAPRKGIAANLKVRSVVIVRASGRSSDRRTA